MLHLQGNMQHSPLGISIINAHSGSVSFKTRQGEGNLLSRASSHHLTVKYHWICFSDVSVLHKRVALPGVPVSHHSLPAHTPAGVLAHPNWTTGTGRPCHESLVFKGRNYKLLGNSRKKTSFLVCVRPFLVCNWWNLQQHLIQQPKFIHSTSSGSTRTRSAAENFPQAHLFVQVRQPGPDNPNNMNL